MGRHAARFRIEGRVQGVGFRWWTVVEAARLGLDGWARNCADGSVEVLAIGDPDALNQLAQALASGPAAARVTAVRRTPAEDDGSRGFDQRPNV